MMTHAELAVWHAMLPEFVARTSRVAMNPKLREDDSMWETLSQEKARKHGEWLKAHNKGRKLTDDDVRNIRESKEPGSVLARKYQMGLCRITAIRRGESYKGVK